MMHELEKSDSFICLSGNPHLTELALAISLNYQKIQLEVEMKRLFVRVIVLGILAGVGYLVCKKFCNKDNCGCGCKKEA